MQEQKHIAKIVKKELSLKSNTLKTNSEHREWLLFFEYNFITIKFSYASYIYSWTVFSLLLWKSLRAGQLDYTPALRQPWQRQLRARKSPAWEGESSSKSKSNTKNNSSNALQLHLWKVLFLSHDLPPWRARRSSGLWSRNIHVQVVSDKLPTRPGAPSIASLSKKKHGGNGRIRSPFRELVGTLWEWDRPAPTSRILL